MVKNEIKKTAHSYSEVMRAIDKLSEEEKNVVLGFLKVNEIKILLDDKDAFIQYCNEWTVYANRLTLFINSMKKLYEMIDMPTDTVDEIVCDYNKLDEDKKKEITLKLMNNGTFQKDCCKILVGDMERLVKESPTLKNINDTFNIVGWYKRNVERGIGMNHKYEV